MNFEVINKDGKIVMHTSSIQCVPTASQLDLLTSAGYRYKLDGKTVSKSNISKCMSATPSVNVAHLEHTKGVRCIETGELYRNRVEAGKAYGISDSSVGDSIRLKKKVKGYSFEII